MGVPVKKTPCRRAEDWNAKTCVEGGDPSRNEDRDTYVRKFLKVHALESKTFAFNFLALIVKLEILSYLKVAQML